jgi:hypothetical protein
VTPDAQLYETPISRDYTTFAYTMGANAFRRLRSFNGRACLVAPAVSQSETVYAVVTAEDTTTLPALQQLFPGGTPGAQLAVNGAPYATLFHIPAGTAVALPAGQIADFDSTVRLLQVDVSSATVSAGSSITLTLMWQLLKTTAADLKSFVHVLGPERADGNPLYAQHDAEPCDNSYPTWQWAAGEVVFDRPTLTVPADTPPGAYALRTGWYDAATLARLPAADAAGASVGDGVSLGTLQVTPP